MRQYQDRHVIRQQIADADEHDRGDGVDED